MIPDEERNTFSQNLGHTVRGRNAKHSNGQLGQSLHTDETEETQMQDGRRRKLHDGSHQTKP